MNMIWDMSPGVKTVANQVNKGMFNAANNRKNGNNAGPGANSVANQVNKGMFNAANNLANRNNAGPNNLANRNNAGSFASRPLNPFALNFRPNFPGLLNSMTKKRKSTRKQTRKVRK
jgi:hypothetical protein